MGRRVERTRGNGRYTESQFFGFIRSGLRQKYNKWGPKYDVLREARAKSRAKRFKWKYRCAKCKKLYPQKEISVDHIVPCGSLRSFSDLPTFVERLFVEKEGLQVLCTSCHTQHKTPQDKLERDYFTSIRDSFPREESSWRNMLSRCDNPNSTGYQYYGGKGISYQEDWKDFYNFYEDMGPRPDNTTLDRIDYNGHYTKENCRWATPIQQARNTSSNYYLEWDGKVLCIQEWAELLGVKANTIVYRLRRGWSNGQALGKEPEPSTKYNGRLSVEDIQEMIFQIDSGMSQSEWARQAGIDSSQVSRLYRRFKTQEDKDG